MVYSKAVDVTQPVYHPESTRGTFFNAGAGHDPHWIGKNVRLMFVERFGQEPIYPIGSYSAEDIPNIGKAYMFQLFFVPQDHVSIDFLKFAFSESASTGSALTSLSMSFSTSIAGSTYYCKLKNTQLVGARIGFNRRGVIRARVDCAGLLDTFDTSAPTNWNAINDPATSPFLSTDGGTTSLTLTNQTTGASVTPKCESLFYNIACTPDIIDQATADTWVDNPIANINRSIELVAPLEVVTLRTWADAGQYINADWTIKSTGSHALKFTHGKIDSFSLIPTTGVIRMPLTVPEFLSGSLV